MTPSTADLVSSAELAALRAALERALPAYLTDLERLVNIDCGSYTKAGVDEVAPLDSRAVCESYGATVTRYPNDEDLSARR